MLIDMTKAIFLLIGYILYGSPNDWDKAFSVQLSIQHNPVSARLEVVYDPVAIYYKDISYLNIGGYAFGSYVVVQEHKTAQDILLQHELNHIWQARTYGFLMTITYPFGIWEPNPYVYTNLNMPSPRQLNWGLFRFWIPLGGW